MVVISEMFDNLGSRVEMNKSKRIPKSVIVKDVFRRDVFIILSVETFIKGFLLLSLWLKN